MEAAQVSGDGNFVFWDQPEDPTKRVLLRSAKAPHTGTSDRAQLSLALSELAPEVDRIVVSLSTIEPAVVYRYRQNWKFRAVGKGYHSGLFGLARDHGVNVTA
jgi:stress response protein SCP2